MIQCLYVREKTPQKQTGKDYLVLQISPISDPETVMHWQRNLYNGSISKGGF